MQDKQKSLEPYTFKYHSTFGYRNVADLTGNAHLIELYKKNYDYILINPPFTRVCFGPVLTHQWTTSDSMPSLNITLDNVAIMNRNSLPSLLSASSAGFTDEILPQIREYLKTRGWWCGVRVPRSRAEIADIERICYIGGPMWRAKQQEEVKNCDYDDFYIK